MKRNTRKILFTFLLSLTRIPIATSYDGERKLDDESKSTLTIKWGGSTNSKKQFLDTSYLDLVNATEVEIQLGEGKVALFNAVSGIPPMTGFFHGHSNGQDANIYKNPETNNVFGSIVDSGTNEIHQIFTNAIGETEVVTKNVDDFTEDGDIAMNAPKSNVGFFGRLLGDNPMLRSSPLNQPRALYEGDGIDVMVVWTKKAECKNSGLLSSCALTSQTRKNMLGKITLAIDETNTAFALSDVGTQLRLVEAYLDDTYDESSTNQALQDLTFQYDGKLEGVHDKRGTFAADVVSLWVDVPSGCGLAWVGPNKDYMFSVVNWSCATGYFSFGHELVHNLGCNHDRGTESDCTNPKPNYGYRDPNGKFRDMMAYNCKSGQCDNVASGSCTRVQRFSNTVSNYEGAPIGNAQCDCASHINSNVASVINYFPAKTDEDLIELGQFQQDEIAPTPTPSPTASDCKGYNQRCFYRNECCNKCRRGRCR